MIELTTLTDHGLVGLNSHFWVELCDKLPGVSPHSKNITPSNASSCCYSVQSSARHPSQYIIQILWQYICFNGRHKAGGMMMNIRGLIMDDPEHTVHLHTIQFAHENSDIKTSYVDHGSIPV